MALKFFDHFDDEQQRAYFQHKGCGYVAVRERESDNASGFAWQIISGAGQYVVATVGGGLLRTRCQLCSG
jgi:hypothetical protein